VRTQLAMIAITHYVVTRLIRYYRGDTVEEAFSRTESRAIVDRFNTFKRRASFKKDVDGDGDTGGDKDKDGVQSMDDVLAEMFGLPPAQGGDALPSSSMEYQVGAAHARAAGSSVLKWRAPAQRNDLRSAEPVDDIPTGDRTQRGSAPQRRAPCSATPARRVQGRGSVPHAHVRAARAGADPRPCGRPQRPGRGAQRRRRSADAQIPLARGHPHGVRGTTRGRGGAELGVES
jgi:hypothetical protein